MKKKNRKGSTKHPHEKRAFENVGKRKLYLSLSDDNLVAETAKLHQKISTELISLLFF